MENVVEVSHEFFEQIVLPFLQEHFVNELSQMACGIFGYGSECLGMDDEISRDHHWGVRVDILMPDEMFHAKSDQILQQIAGITPETFSGLPMQVPEQEGQTKGTGIAPESLESFLLRTIGLTAPPKDYHEWLSMPEEDILHVVNGEVWHDPCQKFTKVRKVLQGYYPEPVWLSRISQACSMFSGGVYTLTRATQRNNAVSATTSFGQAIKCALWVIYLLNRQYYPWEKWIYPLFRRLPQLSDVIDPLIIEAVDLDTSWERRLSILEEISDILDEKLVDMGVIPPHPKFLRSSTSGYRLLEHAEAEILRQLPNEIQNSPPCWDQVHHRKFNTHFIPSIPIEEWDKLLNLTAIE